MRIKSVGSTSCTKALCGRSPLLNQYQRQRDNRGRVVTAPEDLREACEILFESIVLKVDELDGSLRQFFENVKKHVGKLGKDYAFNRFELRKITGVSKTQQHRYLSKLVELEYVQQNGFANRGYHYKIAHWDDTKRVAWTHQNGAKRANNRP